MICRNVLFNITFFPKYIFFLSIISVVYVSQLIKIHYRMCPQKAAAHSDRQHTVKLFEREPMNINDICHLSHVSPQIDSIQSLMQCPSVLVCAGREPFRPPLAENLRKLSDERLPAMGTRSRSSVCSEGQESKKNGKHCKRCTRMNHYSD